MTPKDAWKIKYRKSRIARREIWKPVHYRDIDFPYEVSNLGKVRNRKGQNLKPWIRGSKGGEYPCVDLYLTGVRTRVDVHRLVALHHVPNPENKPEVNHKDTNHMNPAAWNLEWCTHIENVQHRFFMESLMTDEEKINEIGRCKYEDACDGLCAGCKQFEEAV